MSSIHYKSTAADFETAPQLVTDLLAYWQSKCGDAGEIPRREDIQPWDIPRQLGRICVIDVTQDPLDFIYRLDGTEISGSSNEDLRGRSILEGTPKEIYVHVYDDLKQAFEAGKPTLTLIDYTHDSYRANHLRAVFPMSDNGNPTMLMTFSHSLLSPDGSFEPVR